MAGKEGVNKFNRARWAFRMYDKDSSGEIDLDEMVEIFCLMYAVQVRHSPT